MCHRGAALGAPLGDSKYNFIILLSSQWWPSATVTDQKGFRPVRVTHKRSGLARMVDSCLVQSLLKVLSFSRPFVLGQIWERYMSITKWIFWKYCLASFVWVSKIKLSGIFWSNYFSTHISKSLPIIVLFVCLFDSNAVSCVAFFNNREIRNAKSLTYIHQEAFKDLPNLKYLWVRVLLCIFKVLMSGKNLVIAIDWYPTPAQT